MTTRQLIDVVERTMDALEHACLPLDMPGSRELAQSRLQLLTQLRTRILPHLTTSRLPAVIVLGGSSGAGKSTLFNTLVGKEISPASVLRPTTRTPVIAIHPMNRDVMEGHALLPMGRVEVLDSAIPGIVLVDAPDLDSVEAANREISHRLLDAADLWVFVTTAARYGDASAWRTLEKAHARGISTAIVLNRVDSRHQEKIRADLDARISQAGLGDSPLMLIDDAGPHEGMLPRDFVFAVRQWLLNVASSNVAQTLVDDKTRATLPALHDQLLELAEAVELQANTVQDLRDRASVASVGAVRKITTNITHARYGKGAPTTAWLTYASTGGTLAPLVTGQKPGFFARKNTAMRDNAMTAVFDAVLSALHVALRQAVAAADRAIEESWSEDIVDTTQFRQAGHNGIEVERLVDEALTAWKTDVARLAREGQENQWLGTPGMASLLGAGAAGVSGAVKALGHVGLAGKLEEARRALIAHCEEAIGRVVLTYAGTLDSLEVGNGRQLRVRASEYAGMAHAQMRGVSPSRKLETQG